MAGMTTKVVRLPYQWIGRFVALLRRWEFWLFFAGASLLAGALWWWSGPLAALLAQASQLRSWILEFGPLAPLVYIVVFSLQILLAPLPGQFMGVMGGYLFGVLLGSLYSISGLMLGAGLAMLLGRRFGRPLVQRFFSAAEVALWEKKLRTRSPFTWWLLFVFPVPDLIFYVAGLSSVPLRVLLVTLLAGRGLGLLVANLLGFWTAHLTPEWILVKWAAIGILALLAYFSQRRLRLWVLLGARRARRWSRGRASAT
jgi:uncharacterized membrane protein YdjX (TVP38/TMEM64 family)